jgi:fatty-acyl-CoA synthase
MSHPAVMKAYEPRLMGDLPVEAARLWGDREALVFGDLRWTHAEFAAEVDRVAKGLIGIGVQPGDKVGIWMTNRPEWLFLMYAIPAVGAVTVPFNTRYRSEDVQYTVDQSDTSTLIFNDRSGPIDYSAMVREVMGHWPKVRRMVVVGDDRPEGALRWNDMLAAGDSVSEATRAQRASSVRADDPMIIIYTSGTTSLPKGAVHTHAVIRNVAERAQMHGITVDDVHAGYLPLFHAFGYTEVALFTVLTGSRTVLFEAFDAEVVLDAAEREGITFLHGFDTHFSDFLRANKSRPRNLAVRFGTLAAGQESSTPIARRVQEELHPTASGWGMSEVWTACVVGHISNTVEQRTEASGYPMLGVELRVIDPETGEDRPTGEPGELLCRSYTTMLGYYEKPEATAETIDADGWLHSGDLARLRPDGHIVFMGRLKDMLKVGGENVAPAEMEGRLRELPGVMDVAVVGRPDERLGEVPVAYVLREPGADLDPAHLLDHLRDKVASFKLPRHVKVVDVLPMTPTGKIRKVELREQALDDFA